MFKKKLMFTCIPLKVYLNSYLTAAWKPLVKIALALALAHTLLFKVKMLVSLSELLFNSSSKTLGQNSSSSHTLSFKVKMLVPTFPWGPPGPVLVPRGMSACNLINMTLFNLRLILRKQPAWGWGSGTVSGLPRAGRKPSWTRTCRSRRCNSVHPRSSRIWSWWGWGHWRG